MSSCPDGFQPVIDRKGNKLLPDSWHNQLVLFVLPGQGAPQAMRFEDLPRRINKQRVFFRASIAAVADDDAPQPVAEPIVAPVPAPAPKPRTEPLLFRRNWRVQADALPQSRWINRIRVRKQALVQSLSGNIHAAGTTASRPQAPSHIDLWDKPPFPAESGGR